MPAQQTSYANFMKVDVANSRLAVISPVFGARSETFIRRHLNDILPGRTACIYQYLAEGTVDEWSFHGPRLQYDHKGSGNTKAGMPAADKQPPAYKLEDDQAEQILRFIQDQHITVLLSQYLDQSLPWIELAKTAGVPLFVHAHGYDVSMLLRMQEWREAYLNFNKCAGIIAVSQVSKHRLIDIGIHPRKVHVIPCTVGNENLIPPTKPQDGLIRCLSVGRMVAKKAPLTTLAAFAEAVKLKPNLRLDYIGDGPLLASAMNFVQASGLSNCVTLHQSQPHSVVQSMMAQSDIFIHHAVTDPATGDEEGLPVAILEAMRHALPVISTLHSGIREAVIDKRSGYLLDEYDTSGMAEKIFELAESATLRAKFGAQGKLIVKRQFTWHQEKRKLLDIMNISDNDSALRL